MAQPLYFLPRVALKHDATAAAKRQAVQNAGLGEIFFDVKTEDIGFAVIDGKGPGDLSGTIVFYADDREPPPRAGYFPQQQTWHKVDDNLWIGIHNDHPPTPADMRRAKVFRGYDMELGDGQEWVIPIIRRPTDLGTTLPQSQYLEAGKLVKTLKAAYQRYWDHSEEVADGFLAGKEFTNVRAHELAVEALGLNYRFSHNEQKILGVIDSENYIALLSYTIDLPHVREVTESQKKTMHPPAESSTTSTGSLEDCPTTDPHAATCI